MADSTPGSKEDIVGGEDRNRLSAKSTTDPILRNALRYTISAREYETLHRYILSRSRVLKRATPSVARVERLAGEGGGSAGADADPAAAGLGRDFNAAAVRASLRLFVASSAALKVWALITERVLGRRRRGDVR